MKVAGKYITNQQGRTLGCSIARGGGFAAPAIIAGDDRAQLTTSLTATEIAVDSVDSFGVWRRSPTHQKIQTFKIDGAHIFWDRYQGSVPL